MLGVKNFADAHLGTPQSEVTWNRLERASAAVSGLINLH